MLEESLILLLILALVAITILPIVLLVIVIKIGRRQKDSDYASLAFEREVKEEFSLSRELLDKLATKVEAALEPPEMEAAIDAAPSPTPVREEEIQETIAPPVPAPELIEKSAPSPHRCGTFTDSGSRGGNSRDYRSTGAGTRIDRKICPFAAAPSRICTPAAKDTRINSFISCHGKWSRATGKGT